MATFQLKILALDKEFYNGDCEMLIFMSQDGEMGILPNHEDTVAVVSAGELRFLVDGQWRYAAVSEGFAEITGKTVTLMSHSAERPEDIDIKRAQEEAEHAQDMLRQKMSMMEHYQAQLTLAKAMARLKVTGHKKDI